jgi:hypothetical protein
LTAACDDVPPPPERDEPVRATLAVAKQGDGRGVLRSLPAGLACDALCSTAEHIFDDVDEVEVIAEPARDALFRELVCTSGDGSVPDERVDTLDAAGEARLVLPTIDGGAAVDWSCTANFVQVHTVFVLLGGTGSGRVQGALSAVPGASDPRRLDCPDDCTGAYFVGETETLVATPADGSVFSGWEFCASGTAPVTLVVDADVNCRALFDLVE